MPANEYSISNTDSAIKACKDNGVDDILMTIWGDDGAECSKYAVLPTLVFSAEAYKGNTDLTDIKKKFKDLTNCHWDDFMLLDELDKLGGLHKSNPSKYLVYNDVFTGLRDFLVTDKDAEFYRELSLKFDGLDISDEYRYIFDTAKALCQLLSVKADLGVRTRKAYSEKDKNDLKLLVENDYEKTISLTENFNKILWKQWQIENKPYGFDIQDIRMGGVVMRLKNCKERLLEYVNGNIESIPELEEKLLPCTKGYWESIATPNVVAHTYFG